MFKPTQSYSSPTTYSKTYDKFRGVDFSSDPSKVASYRSPDAVNMISDAGGMPEKRVGWRAIKSIESITAMHHCEVACMEYNQFSGETIHLYFAYSEGSLYVWCEELGVSNGATYDLGNAETILFFDTLTGIINEYGETEESGRTREYKRAVPGIICDGKMYVIYNARINSFPDPSGTFRKNLDISMEEVTNDYCSYAPITSIDRSPDGKTSDYLEAVNLLTTMRRNRFKGDGTSTTYIVDGKIDERYASSLSAINLNTGEHLECSVKNASTGEISFQTAPPKAAGADDNIEIVFYAVASDERVDLAKCTLATNVTVGAADNRLILSGHPDLPNYEWYSASNEGLYFPDINYNIVGLATSAIKAYCDYGQYQVIAKEGDGTPNVYLRSYTEGVDGELMFTLTQGSVSADALGAAATLNGQPLFLSSSGVIGVASTAVNQSNSFNNVSYFINERLTQEPNLEKAFAVHHKQKVYIFVNSHVYILDGTQNKAYIEAAVDDYSYECFYWDDVPATCAMSDGETIWFGTEDGYICRFNNDMTGYNRYNNYDINGNSTPVKAHWCTALDYDNSVGIAKTLIRKGTTVTLKPAKRTSADIYVRTDEIPFELVAQFSINTPNFNGFSFKGFAFEVLNTPIDVPVSAVVKNYSYLQIKVQNDKLNEPFGLYGITKYFRKGRYK